jgi:hypothetical protein
MLLFVLYEFLVHQPGEKLLFECDVGKFRDFVVVDNNNLLILSEKGYVLILFC